MVANEFLIAARQWRCHRARSQRSRVAKRWTPRPRPATVVYREPAGPTKGRDRGSRSCWRELWCRLGVSPGRLTPTRIASRSPWFAMRKVVHPADGSGAAIAYSFAVREIALGGDITGAGLHVGPPGRVWILAANVASLPSASTGSWKRPGFVCGVRGRGKTSTENRSCPAFCFGCPSCSSDAVFASSTTAWR